MMILNDLLSAFPARLRYEDASDETLAILARGAKGVHAYLGMPDALRDIAAEVRKRGLPIDLWPEPRTRRGLDVMTETLA